MSAQSQSGRSQLTASSNQSSGEAGPIFAWRSSLAQILALSAALITAYIWLNVPTLEQYSLQVFALCILLYFILKKLNDAAVWEILPTTAVDEMVLVTFAFLILIGGTNGTESIFFPLIFIYLFFLSMTMKLPTAIALSLEVLLFFYALSPSPIPSPILINIPVVMTFFLFAKHQYEQAKEKQAIIEIESNELTSYQIYLQQKDHELDQANDKIWGWVEFLNSFVFSFLQPKIDNLIEMVDYPQNRQAVKGQLTLIRLELEKLKQHLNNQENLNQQAVSESQQSAGNQQGNQQTNQQTAAQGQFSETTNQPQQPA